MTELENLLKLIEVYSKTANIALENVPAKTRPGFEMAKQDAQRELVALRAEYGNRLIASTVLFVVSGPQAKVADFAALAEKEGGTITVDAEEFYRHLAQLIEPSFGTSREFGTQQISLLIQGLRDAAVEFGVVNMESPRLTELVVCRDFGAVVAQVRALVRAAVGDDLNTMYIKKALVEKALERKHTGSVAPVVLVNAEGAERNKLVTIFSRSGQSVPLTNETEVDRDFVIRVFDTAKRQQPKTKPMSKPTNTKQT